MDIWSKLKRQQFESKFNKAGSEHDLEEDNSRSSLVFEARECAKDDSYLIGR